MTLHHGKAFAHLVQNAVGVRRIAVAVEPRLLADTLSRALRRPDVEVTVCGAGPACHGGRGFDVAVVMGDDVARVSAPVVVRIPMELRGSCGSVTTIHGTELVVVDRLGDLVGILDRLLAV